MSCRSHIPIRSLQYPYNMDRGGLPLSDTHCFNMNTAFHHSHSTPNILGLHPSALGIGLSGSSPGSAADTNAVQSSEQHYLPYLHAQVLHAQPSSFHFLLEGISGDSPSLAPSNGQKAELKDSFLSSFTPKSPEHVPMATIRTPAFLDVKAILLPRISLHVQEGVGPNGHRQWYCTFPHCTRSPFLRRDRAEVHVASVHLNEKRIYCNGSCGTAGW